LKLHLRVAKAEPSLECGLQSTVALALSRTTLQGTAWQSQSGDGRISDGQALTKRWQIHPFHSVER
jgi:hypothetical protein